MRGLFPVWSFPVWANRNLTLEGGLFWDCYSSVGILHVLQTAAQAAYQALSLSEQSATVGTSPDTQSDETFQNRGSKVYYTPYPIGEVVMGRRLFESEEDYQKRLEVESNQKILEASGKSSTRRFDSLSLSFEDDDTYANRLKKEADEATILNSGRRVSQGHDESDSDYRSRLSDEAETASYHETIRDHGGSPGRKGLFESREEYRDRMEREATDQILASKEGYHDSRRLLDTDREYQDRRRTDADHDLLQDYDPDAAARDWLGLELEGEYERRIHHQAHLKRRETVTNNITGGREKGLSSGTIDTCPNHTGESNGTTFEHTSEAFPAWLFFTVFWVPFSFWVAPGVGRCVWLISKGQHIVGALLSGIFDALFGPIMWLVGYENIAPCAYGGLCYPHDAWSLNTAYILSVGGCVIVWLLLLREGKRK